MTATRRLTKVKRQPNHSVFTSLCIFRSFKVCLGIDETGKPTENESACARQHVKDIDVRQSANVGQLVKLDSLEGQRGVTQHLVKNCLIYHQVSKTCLLGFFFPELYLAEGLSEKCLWSALSRSIVAQTRRHKDVGLHLLPLWLHKLQSSGKLESGTFSSTSDAFGFDSVYSWLKQKRVRFRGFLCELIRIEPALPGHPRESKIITHGYYRLTTSTVY